MLFNRWKKKIAILITLCLVMTLIPTMSVDAQEEFDDLEVTLQKGTMIGNLSHDATNAFSEFYQNTTQGFNQTKTDSNASYDWMGGDVFTGKGDNGTSVKFVIEVANNPVLQAVAESDHATVSVGWDRLVFLEGCVLFFCWTRISSASITLDGVTLVSGHSGGASGRGARSAKAIIRPDSIIEIDVYGEGDDDGDLTGVRGMYIKFEDKVRPVLDSYTFTGNGQERTNPLNGNQELYVKQEEHITLAYNFSEPVKPTQILPGGYNEHFFKHPLFVNTEGTGLPAAGQQQYMQNITYNAGNLTSIHSSIAFRYTGSRYHQSGNRAVEPKINGVNPGAPPIEQTLEEKMKAAVFADAAGNVAKLNFPLKVNNNSNAYVSGKTIDPFNYNNGGYSVIVDGIAPKYTKVGNGIQPEILTGVTVNNNDTIDFTVQFTEDATLKEAWRADGDIYKTYLHFNNGMKAYYISGVNTDKWTFRAYITDAKLLETPLLKVIALTHDYRVPQDADTHVIEDYAGNPLIQPANLMGEHEDRDSRYVEPGDKGDVALVNSIIDWAQLAIDNTKPLINFRFEADGASNTTYQKNGKVTIDANDPPLLIPHLDPKTSERGEERPSKGIYRPSNMTGSASPAVGLVYYYWSQEQANPFESKAADHYAAIKRYSLSAKQPSEELYPGEFLDVQLQVANNKTNMLAPPTEALTADNSGKWYLHAWTADMTWDSARELMQYEEMQKFIQDNPQQYEAWKNELTNASEADRIFHANNKALAAVGQYGDASIWKLSYFKQEDSNWSYAVTEFLLDNQAPEITMTVIDTDKAVAELSLSITDALSGLKNARYQWVKDVNQPAEIDWKPIPLVNGQATLTSLNEVFEDGNYLVFVRAEDQAGNMVISSQPITVDSSINVTASITPEPNMDFEQSKELIFTINGITPDRVAYVFSTSSIRPASASAYTDLTAEEDIVSGLMTIEGELEEQLAEIGEQPEEATEDEASNAAENSAGSEEAVNEEDEVNGEVMILSSVGELTYRIPAYTDKNGIQYVHVMAKEGDRYYYYSKAYYFDNEPPAVSFSKTGVPYPLEEQDVTVTVRDLYSESAMTKNYQWVREGADAPDETSTSWQSMPQNGRVILGNEALAEGEIAEFRLFVLAEDGAGNRVIASPAGAFMVTRPAGKDTPPAAAEANLIYVRGDAQDGYTAIVQLNLDTVDKRGYEFSVSPDNGESWQKWRPYTNFMSVKVPSRNSNDWNILVKFRAASGAIGEAISVESSTLQANEPVYALATLATTRPVAPSAGLEINVVPPLGIRVMPAAANPSVPVRKGNTFTVRENGYYSFDLTDMNDDTRKSTLYVVVNNVDGVQPQGTVEYSTTDLTSGNVTAQLVSTNKPVIVVNNFGRTAFTFTENGSFTFQLRDEAGNLGSVTATVGNIVKETPQVRIVRSYVYGDLGQYTFGTLLDENDNVLLSSGVTLEVQQADGYTREIFVVDKKNGVTLHENGTVSFLVADKYGNTTVITETVQEIVSDPPQPEEIKYEFVNENGEALSADEIVTIDGKSYAKGSMKVTLSGQTTAANLVFAGMAAITDADGEYLNLISDETGYFSMSRIFSADGSTTVALSDRLGNVNRVPIKVQGLDNKAPELVLNQTAVAVPQNKQDFNARTDLGGYTVSDNVSKPGHIEVTISGLDLNQLGRQRVTYTAKDQVGNEAVAYQDVVVVSEAGMLIFADGLLISGDSGESALFDRNTLTFSISRFNLMDVNGQERVNEWGTYDLLYQSGLYREGQVKYIANKITYQQLIAGQYQITFPQAGWYTIIVRNQERERVYATFFIGKVQP